MKSQKTNAFQLAVAGGVLVLVLICATFAWYASGDNAWDRGIQAMIASQTIPSQLNSIEYYEDDAWKKYGGDVLEVVPGQEWQFKINFTANEGETLQVLLAGLSASLREVSKVTTTGASTNSGSETTQETTTVITEDNMLSDVLEIKINDGEYGPLIPQNGFIVLKETVGEPMDEFNHQEYTYTIRMNPEAKNLYMDKVVSFFMDVTVSGKSVTEETTTAQS